MLHNYCDSLILVEGLPLTGPLPGFAYIIFPAKFNLGFHQIGCTMCIQQEQCVSIQHIDAVLNTRIEAPEGDDDVSVFRPRPEISLQVPRRLLRSLAHQQVRKVSSLFSNVLGLFPNVTLQGIK